MKHRDAIIEDLHKFRERLGRAHDFDVDRIAATIREHERKAGRAGAKATEQRATRPAQRRRRKAAQHRLAADGGQ